jgi:hypothetical protein
MIFEAKELKVHDSNFRMIAVQCRVCGAVVGVRDWLNNANALAKIAEKLGVSLG